MKEISCIWWNAEVMVGAEMMVGDSIRVCDYDVLSTSRGAMNLRNKHRSSLSSGMFTLVPG